MTLQLSNSESLYMFLLIWDSKQLNSYFSDEDTEAQRE